MLSAFASAVAVLVLFTPHGFEGPFGQVLTILVFAVAGTMAVVFAVWRERAAEQVRARVRILADSAPVLMWAADASGRRAFFNQPWLEFTGRSLESELGDGWLANVHPDDRERVRAELATATAAGEAFSLEYRLRRADGAWRHVLDHGVPRGSITRDPALFYVGSAMDATEQRLALDRAEAALAQAEQASRAKDAFLATVSHELRTPLSPILAWTRMLQKGMLDEQQAARAIDVIERNARMQVQIVEDLLDVSRIVAGRLRVHVRPVSLVRVIENAIETVHAAAVAKGVRIETELDPSTPLVSGDPDRLQQAVWNLVSNAVKFTPRGGRVLVTLRRVGSHVEIAVADTGQGIPADQLPHLFERFWQGDPSPSRKYGGLGLGLAIVRHLVELHGGTVVAESPGEGAGSTFTIRLPVPPFLDSTIQDARRLPALSSEAAPLAETRLDGVRVLLVDDEPDANEVVRTLLSRLGAEVRVAASAAQALEILERWLPDVLVSDIGLPGEDGLSLIAKVRARSDGAARLPAIALTAYASDEDRARVLAAGFQWHLSKPAEPGAITAAINAGVGPERRG